jgi:PAS domain S-box-containing protein
MAVHQVSPVDAERPFAAGELFFSTTDPKGIIQRGNDVFVRVSGHPRERLVGSPHNIIRHPDMPQSVFKLMWDYLGAGKSFSGFVKNMAADGRYYWVKALVLPIDNGYLSIRFKPSSAYLPVVQSLYVDMLRTERQAGKDWRQGMRKSGEQLAAALKAHGFAGYDDFMQTTLASELAGRRPAAEVEDGTAGPQQLRDILSLCRRANALLGETFLQVDGVVKAINSLDANAGFLLGLSSKTHLISLNALIASSHLHHGGEGLSVISQNMATLSSDSTSTIDTMTGHLRELTSSLRATAFSITAAKLQVEMTVFFLRELLGRGRRDGQAGETADGVTEDVDILVSSLAASTRQLAEALPKARRPLPMLGQLQNQLRGDLRRLSSVHVIGRLQAAGIPNEAHFRGLFGDVATQLERATNELDALSDGIVAMRDRRLPALERNTSGISETLAQVRGLAHTSAPRGLRLVS